MRKKRFKILLYIAIFIVVELVFGYFTLESRNLFVENSIKYGGYLAQAQTDKIETQMNEYVSSIELAGKYVDEMINGNASDEAIQLWMKSYTDKIAQQFGENILDIYAVLNGHIIGANPWEGDDDYDFASTDWYSDAIVATPGTAVFSDLYKDAITGQNVFTISLALSDTSNVIAMDVYLADENWMGFTELADGYGLLVYDSRQVLAYSSGHVDTGILQEDLVSDSSAELSHYAGTVRQDFNLYVCKLHNNWSVVVQIPSEDLIPQHHMLIMNLGLGLNVLNMLIAMVFLAQNLHRSRYIRYDSLTGVLSKAYLAKYIRNQLKRSNGTLLVVDLDNFKKVNDNYGHDCGDMVLVRVADILQNCFRRTDGIGRFGGDEFVVYVDSALTDEIVNAKAQEVIRQITALAEQYPRSELSVSIGGYRCKKGDKYNEVFRYADKALYEVKNSGKCGFVMSRHT